jgi:hypothetical protein
MVQQGLKELAAVPEPYQSKLREEGMTDSGETVSE